MTGYNNNYRKQSNFNSYAVEIWENIWYKKTDIELEGEFATVQKPVYDIALSYASDDKEIVDSVYHYLCGNGLTVFYAPECQEVLVSEHQEEIFHRVFSKDARHAVLFVSCYYVAKPVPMKEAKICMANRRGSKLIPIYMDGTALPGLDPAVNYFRSSDAEKIAAMIIKRIAPLDTPKWEPAEQTFSNAPEKIINIIGNGNQIAGGDINN